jgi:histidine triad (HIT) family protein
VPHVHIHVLPRRLGDELKVNWELKPGDRARVAELAERIRAEL